MNSDRKDKLKTTPGQKLIDSDTSMPIKSMTGPSMTFFNGQLWIAYIDPQSRVYVACRHDNDPTTDKWKTYQVWTNVSDGAQAMSDYRPSICAYQNKLMVFWKGRSDEFIRCQAQDGTGNWWSKATQLKGVKGGDFQSANAPVAAATLSRLTLAWIDRDDKIWFSSTDERTANAKWWDAATQDVKVKGTPATSSYPPAIAVLKDATHFYWRNSENGGILHALLDNSKVVAPDGPLDRGNWQAGAENAVLTRGTKAWIISPAENDQNDISVMTNGGKKRISLMNANPDAYSARPCGAAIVPGIPTVNAKPWRIFLTWRMSTSEGDAHELREQTFIMED